MRRIFKSKLPIIALAVALIVVVCGALLMHSSSPDISVSKQSPMPIVSPQPNLRSSVPTALVTPTKKIIASAKHGHFSYDQADPNSMVIIASYATEEYQRFESLRPDAAKALMKMIYAARDGGIWIVPVSGFRTIEQQQKLFEAQIEHRGFREAAKFSAPPGYSEHHTGFAIDLADGNFPKQDLTEQFENTKAYEWLTRCAGEFGFELSFPSNNSQGVSYEPWHWRYVGSHQAEATFAKARK